MLKLLVFAFYAWKLALCSQHSTKGKGKSLEEIHFSRHTIERNPVLHINMDASASCVPIKDPTQKHKPGPLENRVNAYKWRFLGLSFNVSQV